MGRSGLVVLKNTIRTAAASSQLSQLTCSAYSTLHHDCLAYSGVPAILIGTRTSQPITRAAARRARNAAGALHPATARLARACLAQKQQAQIALGATIHQTTLGGDRRSHHRAVLNAWRKTQVCLMLSRCRICQLASTWLGLGTTATRALKSGRIVLTLHS